MARSRSNPADCGGEAVHTITATKRPARLEFQAGGVPLSDLVTSCIDGCPYQLRPADDFPELPFPATTNELAIELEFKARGHRSETPEYRLSPGTNQHPDHASRGSTDVGSRGQV